MRCFAIAAGLLPMLIAVGTFAPNQEIEMKKLTPVLQVDSIEPVLSFWEDRLGFERTLAVPGETGLAFVAFQKGPVEIMYQTRASIGDDLPQLLNMPMGGTMLFIEVGDIDAVELALEGADIVNPRRTTFYGATEVAVREPGGNIVIFAEMSAD
ncbi:MAG: VOC family protein [Gemmatimonadales bacterium]|nr:MAG: VOC family protein [Gemmatimonadales bacterium]